MSHLKERKEKNCLNCNAQVHGKYCSICGQENIEPEETVWHLITHFFNDITHFDGKFFSTLNLLIFKPGFLSAEYKFGRRAAYLNPVRMYIFTSFVFFLVFFSIYKIEESAFDDNDGKPAPLRSVLRMDSASLVQIRADVETMDSASYMLYITALNNGTAIPRSQFFQKLDSSLKYPYPVHVSPLLRVSRMDSLPKKIMISSVGQMSDSTFQKFTRTINNGEVLTRKEFDEIANTPKKINSGLSFSKEYESRAQYDSLVKIGKVKHGWFKRTMTNRFFDINERYANNTGKLMSTLINIVFHNFPQMLFISLPLFALFLKLIYVRHKDFYFVSHGIYSLHLYIFYFIVLLVLMGIQKLTAYLNTDGFGMAATILTIVLLFYEYKAMRNFYGQRRAKTVLKFLLATSFRFFLISVLLTIFFFFSLLKV